MISCSARPSAPRWPRARRPGRRSVPAAGVDRRARRSEQGPDARPSFDVADELVAGGEDDRQGVRHQPVDRVGLQGLVAEHDGPAFTASRRLNARRMARAMSRSSSSGSAPGCRARGGCGGCRSAWPWNYTFQTTNAAGRKGLSYRPRPRSWYSVRGPLNPGARDRSPRGVRCLPPDGRHGGRLVAALNPSRPGDQPRACR